MLRNCQTMRKSERIDRGYTKKNKTQTNKYTLEFFAYILFVPFAIIISSIQIFQCVDIECSSKCHIWKRVQASMCACLCLCFWHWRDRVNTECSKPGRWILKICRQFKIFSPINLMELYTEVKLRIMLIYPFLFFISISVLCLVITQNTPRTLYTYCCWNA